MLGFLVFGLLVLVFLAFGFLVLGFLGFWGFLGDASFDVVRVMRVMSFVFRLSVLSTMLIAETC